MLHVHKDCQSYKSLKGNIPSFFFNMINLAWWNFSCWMCFSTFKKITIFFKYQYCFTLTFISCLFFICIFIYIYTFIKYMYTIYILFLYINILTYLYVILSRVWWTLNFCSQFHDYWIWKVESPVWTAVQPLSGAAKGQNVNFKGWRSLNEDQQFISAAPICHLLSRYISKHSERKIKPLERESKPSIKEQTFSCGEQSLLSGESKYPKTEQSPLGRE